MSDKTKITAGRAAMKIIASWGVKEVYGIPAGSLNTWMDALYEERDKVRFIQVRHEEVGALAASMHAKFTGGIGVCLGSGGPGGTHLMNGLYDAREDNVPVLAIIGTRPLSEVNIDGFQELNQNPIYADVSVYNRRVAYPEQLPKLIDEGIRRALALGGPATIEVPADFGWAEIDNDSWYTSAPNWRKPSAPRLNMDDVKAAAELLNKAERPVIYAGIGTRHHGEDVLDLSKKLKAPIATTGKNYETFHFDEPAFLGSAGRVSWKSADDTIWEADTILFAGSDYPFAESSGLFRGKKFIQIDINPMMLGKRNPADVAILGDAPEAIRTITELVDEKPESPWYRAVLKNNQNWRDYMRKLETKTEGPLQAQQIFHQMNERADEDAIYSVDIGNTTQNSVRHLHLTPKNLWRTSPKFATMGNGLPGAIAAKQDFPERQVWSLSGDGGFSMVMQDIVTAVQHNLPSIHVVFCNEAFGFIKKAQEATNEHVYFGVDFRDIDYAKIAEAQGAIGLTVTEPKELDRVFEAAIKAEKAGKVVVIDAKMEKTPPFPVEAMKLDTDYFSEEEVEGFKERFEAQELLPFRHFLEEEGLSATVTPGEKQE